MPINSLYGQCNAPSPIYLKELSHTETFVGEENYRKHLKETSNVIHEDSDSIFFIPRSNFTKINSEKLDVLNYSSLYPGTKIAYHRP